MFQLVKAYLLDVKGYNNISIQKEIILFLKLVFVNNFFSAETQLTEYTVKEGEVLKQLDLVTISKREVELVCCNHSE